MEQIIELFYKIQNTSSLLEKQKIIMDNKENELFKKCLVFLLSGDVVTGISEQKLKKQLSSEIKRQNPYLLPEFEDVMSYLRQNNTGKDIDIYRVQEFLSRNQTHRDFYEKMVTKKFRLGVDAKTINKIIPGLIPTFDVMLGTPFEKCNIPENTWFSISQKLNGNRCVYYNGELYTRQGKLYTGLDHIKKEIENVVTRERVLDGELIYRNTEGLTDSEAFQKGTGIANSNQALKTELIYVIFDILTKEEFNRGYSDKSYSERFKTLNSLSGCLQVCHYQHIKVVPFFYQGIDQSQIWKWLDYAEEHDMEGIMLNLNTPYECKRTKNLIKVKKFKSCDLLCTGVEEGTGRNKGKLGAIICDYKGFPLKVGSGFSADDREHFWKWSDEIVGKIVSVKYKEETRNKDGGISVQFPVFECIRYDKDEPNYE